MKNKKSFWLSIAVVNLCIVALLGATLRSKILFSLQGIDFKYVLHAHSHFAFGGWITLALMSLMIYEILPAPLSNKKTYQWLLWGILLNAAGMLVSFLCQGYAFFSILFSTLFIFVTYVFSYVFIRDLIKTRAEKSISILCISALVCLSVSSVGPFTLAYLMASKSGNFLLYRDSIYTYLHLQYNGFFSLVVFALFLNCLYKSFTSQQLNKARNFAIVLSFSVIPTLFISYLWHYPSLSIRIAAITGCVSVVAVVAVFINFLRSIRNHFQGMVPFTRNLGMFSLIAFVLKSILQTGTVIPTLGKLVFGDRSIIIGYLHLVLLAYISLYLLAHLLHNGILNVGNKLTRTAIIIFAGGVIANETILMVQGFGDMLMISNSIYSWLLWGASLCLFSGAVLIAIAKMTNTGIRQAFSTGDTKFLRRQFHQTN